MAALLGDAFGWRSAKRVGTDIRAAAKEIRKTLPQLSQLLKLIDG